MHTKTLDTIAVLQYNMYTSTLDLDFDFLGVHHVTF